MALTHFVEGDYVARHAETRRRRRKKKRGRCHTPESQSKKQLSRESQE
jgi:hypothetical protein